MIVVTGAAGFIGSNFVSALNEDGSTDIAICDFFESGEKWRNLAKTAFTQFIQPAELIVWLKQRSDIEAVIHMGAISATTALDGDLVMHTNFSLSLALLDFCTSAGVPLLYASSAAVYGDGSAGFEDSIAPADILKLRPLNLYGWSKRQFDFVVADRIARGRPMPPVCTGLRFFNVFGPNEYHKGSMMSIVAKIADPIQRGERITLFKSHRDGIADGDQRRDFIYVKDAVMASLGLLQNARTGIFNIGTGTARSFRELAEATFVAFGRQPAIDYIDMPEEIREKYQYFTQASTDNLRQAGYAAPFASLEDNVADYVRSYLGREDRYR
ncbi:ADP-glyceromanno-heptose 6-epimerase [Sphingomonas sp.]|uniref:ADP-glyceromanno-heptose 6-epimerase n=1 Tax=Sphingomonas sp. TaxID=28214 RepID=UPI003B3A75BB